MIQDQAAQERAEDRRSMNALLSATQAVYRDYSDDISSLKTAVSSVDDTSPIIKAGLDGITACLADLTWSYEYEAIIKTIQYMVTD